MSSPNPKPQSPSPQDDKHKPPLTIQEIVSRVDKLLTDLAGVKDDKTKVSKLTSHQDEKDGDSKPTAEEKPNPLDKAYNELKYLKTAFEKLKKFETDLDKPLLTLKKNVEVILADLDAEDSAKDLIELNLKALRNNITKVKAQIPLQHQASSISEARYLQTTNASKDVRMLLDPYEADGIFESRTFLKEFQDHYSDLDDRPREKLCLLCFAIFPENAVVKKRLLRFWWEGEKLIPEIKEKEKEKENLSVNKILAKFVEMGFIEPVTKRSRSKVTSYRMHPIIRCLLIRFAQAVNFFHFDPKGYPDQRFFRSKKLCLVKSDQGFSWWSKDVPSKEIDPNAKPNQKGKSGKEDEKAIAEPNESDPNAKPNQQGKNGKDDEKQKTEKEMVEWEKKRVTYLENLQTLFNVSKQFPDLREELFSKMKNIGVLYLGRWEPTAQRHMEVENTDFLEGLKNMNKLRFFSLQGVSGISTLPKSLGNLYNLRILDLRACHNLVDLPEEVGSLKRLIHLDLSECYLLENIPKHLSNLPNLKVLKGFLISKSSKCTLQRLTKLSNLVKLSINVNDKDFKLDSEETVTHFSKFKMLRKLKIAWGARGKEAKSTTIETTHGEAKSKQGDKDKKPQASRIQESETTKPMVRKFIQKLKSKAWRGVHGEGSSKSVPETKPADPTEKEVYATPPKQVDNKEEKPQMELKKLDLQCYPGRELPQKLIRQTLKSLERLYIKGGELSNLGEIDQEWEVKTLRLKYLLDVKINWKELKMQFSKLEYLEKVNCPQIAFCPCDASGVWVSKDSKQPPTN